MKKEMRKTIIYTWLAIGVAMTSCSSDDVIATAEIPAGLSVTVEDAGYVTSRAEEQGYTTVFTVGDKIGVYAVKGGEILAENACLQAVAGLNGKVTWQPVGVLANDAEATYFAYYPYVESLPAAVDATAADAEQFFAAVADAWQVAEDQSDYAAYTASDFMTASAKIDENQSLRFVLNHRMALAEITFPTTRYVFTNEPAIPDYVLLKAENIVFNGFKPFEKKEAALYAYIVNPSATGQALSGSYGKEPMVNEWSFTPNVKPGTVNTYNIDRKKGEGEIKHLLQVGDFFLSDGRLLSKDADASVVKAADVVGIVFNINPDRIGDDEKQALGGVVHATVFSVTEAEYNNTENLFWSSAARDETAIGFKEIIGPSSAVETIALADAELSGLHNLNLIRTKRPAAYEGGQYEAFKAAADHGKDTGNYNVLAGLTTGWYLPTLGQWLDLARNIGEMTLDTSSPDHFIESYMDMFYWLDNVGTPLDKVNATMSKIDADFIDKFDRNEWIWTSTVSATEYAYVVNFTNGERLSSSKVLNTFSCFGNPKTGFYHVRPVLVF